MGISDRRLQTIAFQLDVETFEQLWNAAKDIGVSVDEVLRQAVVIWLSQRTPAEVTESEAANQDKQKTSIEQLEENLIKETLAKYNGNKSKAAEALGISTRTLYRRLEKYC